MKNRPGKTMAALTLFAIIGWGVRMVANSNSPDPRNRPGTASKEASVAKTSKRRVRTGPRTPPPQAPPIDEQSKTDDPAETADGQPEDNHGSADAEENTNQAYKLVEYLEHLEALDDPNVDELTMLGEMAFDANEPEAAYEHYLEVIDNHTDDPQAPFALYKLAWTEFNLGDVEAAIDDMELVIEWIGEGETPLQEALLTAGSQDLDRFRRELD